MLGNLVAAMRVRRVRGYQVAEAAGISESRLSRFINGHEDLGPVQRQQIAQFLGADPGWLFSRKLEIPPLPKPAITAAASVGTRGS